MIEGVTADIWRFWPWCWVVIPTNAGWRKDGTNVMGAGLALQAARKFKWLPGDYGEACRQTASRGNTETIRTVGSGLITFAVKPLNVTAPHLSWQQPAKLGLITQSARDLSEIEFSHDRQVCVPLVGCGNGGLKERDVLPILRKYLTSDRFILVRWG